MTNSDIAAVKAFTDMAIGQDYYSSQELLEILERSTADGRVFTLLLVDGAGAGVEEVCGVRITYPPGRWQKGKGRGLHPEKWGVPLTKVAYFQSLFIAPNRTGQSWGKKLSLASLEMLRAAGALAVVCHSWKESPQDSSGRYLRSLGFEAVATHPLYWKDVDYVCTRCGKPCLCTAEEMIKRL